MRYQISGKQIDVGDALSTHVKTELGETIDKYSQRPTDATVIFSRNAHEFTCDAVVHLSTGLNVQAKGASTEIYAAFEQCKERMDKQLRRYKRRLKDHHKDRAEPIAFEPAGMYVLAADEEEWEARDDGLHPMIIAEMETRVPTLSVGEAVQDTTQVFTISDLRSVWAEMRVAAPDLPAVRVGEKATVRATAFDSSATGEVAYVGALIGQDTRTAPARITLPNPDGVWRPGLFVNVELTASSRQAPLAVATQALQKMEQQTVVFVPVQGGFRAQPVRVGRSDGKATEVLEGLKPGQSYVAEGSFMLKAELGKATAEHSH